jgi:hypothetical protein
MMDPGTSVKGKRPAAGREQASASLFPEFLGYLEELKKKGDIDSHEVVVLSLHGGDLEGFFLIRGDNDQLDALQQAMNISVT